MRLTKLDMARVIQQALRNLPALPPADDERSVKMAQRSTVERLERQHRMALDAINSVIAQGRAFGRAA